MFDLDKILGNLSPVKMFVIGVLITSMFWYLSIFLFNKSIITNEQVQIPIIISLCFGFVWSSIATACSAIRTYTNHIDNKKIPNEILNQKKLETKITPESIILLFYSPLFLAMEIALYVISNKYAISPTKFYGFTILAFSTTGLLLIYYYVPFHRKLYRWRKELLKKQLEIAKN